MLFKKNTLIALCLLVLALMMTGGAQAGDNKLKIGLSQFPSTLHPAIDSMSAKSYVLAATRRGITIYNPDWELVCVLCTQVPSFSNGRIKRVKDADGTARYNVHFTLKQTKWADGTPLTTKDILFSYEAGKDPLSGFTNTALFQEYIKDIEVLDAYNFIIHYKSEFCDAANLNDFEILPAHVERPIFVEDAQNYKNKTLYDRDPTTKGLYNGPYMISHLVKGRFVELSKNPHWWGEEPYFDQVRIEAVENTSALTARLLAGQIDMIAGEVGLAFDQALNFEQRLKRQDKPFQVKYQSGLIYEHLDFNMDLEIFQDLKMRQALLYGINRQVIVDELFGGEQKIANASVHPLDQFFDKDITRYPYNRKLAETLLDQAGWRYGKDGFRHNDKGERLTFNLYTTSGNKTREIVAQAIQSDWRMIGIDLKIKLEPPRILFGKTLRERTFQGVAMFAYISAPNSVPKTTLHSDMIPRQENGFAGQNFTGYKNDDMDQIIDDLETTCTSSPRAKLWSQLQSLYADDLPALPLYFRSEAYILPKNLKGVQPTGHQYSTTHEIEHWHY